MNMSASPLKLSLWLRLAPFILLLCAIALPATELQAQNYNLYTREMVLRKLHDLRTERTNIEARLQTLDNNIRIDHQRAEEANRNLVRIQQNIRNLQAEITRVTAANMDSARKRNLLARLQHQLLEQNLRSTEESSRAELATLRLVNNKRKAQADRTRIREINKEIEKIIRVTGITGEEQH